MKTVRLLRLVVDDTKNTMPRVIKRNEKSSSIAKVIRDLNKKRLSITKYIYYSNPIKKVRKSLIKQERIESKIRDAVGHNDSKRVDKLTKKWVSQQANIRYDEILQSSDKIESLAKAFIKSRIGPNSPIMQKDYIGLISEYGVEAGKKAREDTELLKKRI